MIKFLIASLIAATCVVSVNANETLKGSEWSLKGTPERYVQFKAKGSVSGNSGCNQFFGQYQQSGDKLRVGSLGSTRKACASDIMRREFEFINALKNTGRFSFGENNKVLILKSKAGKTLRLQKRDWE